MSVATPSQYTCVTCLQYFTTRDLLISHVFDHDLCVNSPLYICKYCGLVYSNLPKLSVHYFQESSNNIMNKPSLVELACAFCAESFSSWCSLTKHVFSYTSAVSGPLYVCTYCSKVFKDLTKLKFHKYTNRIVQRRDICDCKKRSYAYKQQLSIAEFQTKRLQEEIITASSHNNSYKNKQCYKRSKLGELLTVCKLHDTSSTWSCCSFSCEVCGKTFTESRSLKHHQRIHLGEHPFSCDVCRKSFTESGSLKRHQRIHLNERPFSCNVCGKSFTQSGNLKTHQLFHLNERPFSCDVCGKSFTQSGHLKTHQRIHLSERPFSCDVCEKSFKESGCLKRHQRIHLDERPFSCNICGKLFTESKSLGRHYRIHLGELPFSCNVCGKSFSESGNLKRHQLIHLGERPFSCDVCGKSFTEFRGLERHQRIHLGERPFSCDVCGKSYTESGSLKRHQRIPSGERKFSCDVFGKSFSV